MLKKNDKEFYSSEFNAPKINKMFLIIFISFLVIIFLLLENTIFMKETLHGETLEYVSDIGKQITTNLEYKFRVKSIYIQDVADSFPEITDFKSPEFAADFLMDRDNTMGFDEFLILKTKDIYYPYYFPKQYVSKLIDTYPQILKKPVIGNIDGHDMFFSAPIKFHDETSGVLIGINKYKGLRDLLATANFNGKGNSLLVNKNGELLLRSDGKNFGLFDYNQDIIVYESNDDKANRVTLADKLRNNFDGTLITEDKTGDKLFISCHPLEINDWVLLSIVPQDYVVDDSQQPIMNYIYIIILCVLIFLLVLYFISSSYKKMVDKISDIAFVDLLTGGIKTASFTLEANRIFHNDPRSNFSIVFMNISYFQEINEQWGIDEGNKTIKYVHSIIKKCLKEKELVARSEIDHFFILIRENEKDKITERVETIINEVNKYNQYRNVQNKLYKFDFSVGAYTLKDSDDATRIAMGRARRAESFYNHNMICSFYDESFVEKMHRNSRMNELFESSLNNHDFKVYLQPKVHIKQDSPCEAEALVRWMHPDEGLISPAEFIPLFEQTGNICKLDIYVFEEVCKLIKKRIDDNKLLFRISVNLSRAHINDEKLEFIEKIINIKNKYAIPDGIIELEMTESLLIRGNEIYVVQDIINKFNKNGLICSLDDFGFGYSSLGLLKEFNINTIKLDRQFFIGENERSWKVVSGFIKIIHSLGMLVVAEGIETVGQVEMLKRIDCDLIQGFVYSKPMPSEQFEKLFDNRYIEHIDLSSIGKN